MKRSLSLAPSFLALALACIAAPASAQSLDDAQHQLDAGHAAAAAEMATTLIDQGTRIGTELAPLYRLLGLASATAGNDDAAREAFTRWLALDPEGRIDRTLPDEVRSPFLEARGFWASSGQRLGAQAALRTDASGIDVSISDPASMVARVRVRVRPSGGVWADVMRSPAPSLAIDVPGLATAHALDYSITFLDASGNRIWHDGSDDAPLHAGEESHDTTTVTTPPVGGETSPATTSADPTGFIVGAVIAGVIAAGAVVGAAIFHADRERLAGIYNGDGTGCTGTGSTRGDVCGPQHSAIGTDEIAMGVLYGVAGAAAVTAIILAVAAPSSSPSDHAFACGGGPGQIGLACGGTF